LLISLQRKYRKKCGRKKMLEMRARKLPKIERQADMFSQRSVGTLLKEPSGQEVWNTLTGLTMGATTLEAWPPQWSPTARTDTESTPTPRRTYIAKDPTTLFGNIERNQAQVAALVWKIRHMAAIPYRESVANRLSELSQEAREEELGGMGMSAESLSSFYSFLLKHHDLKKPTIGLTPDNEIYVTWRSGAHSVFSIIFLPSLLARFVILAPANRHRGYQAKLSGVTTVDDLLEKVKPWGVLGWAGSEGR
jgi:hypothetical protein